MSKYSILIKINDIETEGKSPINDLVGHISLIKDNKLYIFGGYNFREDEDSFSFQPSTIPTYFSSFNRKLLAYVPII